MKRLLVQTSLTICAFFTICMTACLALGYAFAGPSYGLNLTASILAAALGMGVLQAFWFSEAAFKKLVYTARTAGFGLTALPVLVGCVWLGKWLPIDMPAAWAAFVVVYLLVLASMTAGYAVYFKKTAGSYDEALARYREQNRR